jgi:2-oxoglutarate ferredoxin oxidoreductase subunit alpha
VTDTTAPTTIDRVVIRFAGDSGDGMQLTGDRFTSVSAGFGNDLSTMPDFPAEIRAPAGTLAGVSAFQVHISDHDITTPGDAPDVLVAMNPAALKAELGVVRSHGTVILNSDTFDERNLTKAGYAADPRHDRSLEGHTVYEVPMSSLTAEAVRELGVKPRDADRSKNFFALGLISWMYTRPVEPTVEWIGTRFASKPQVAAANLAAFKAGHAFGETAELFDHAYQVKPAALPPGTYTNITGNTALAWGLVAAGQQAGLPIFLGSYPITPASDILHELSKHKRFGVRTFQAEDEIAGIGAAIGAAFGGHLGVTTTSGPGLSLKAEALGLAVSLELPLVLVDIQRGGPSTGLPTKTEAADLMQAIYGRHGEAPLPVLAARSPAHCFEAAIEAVRIAVTYRTPVILLSDGYLANGAEPWRLPDVSALPVIDPPSPPGRTTSTTTAPRRSSPTSGTRRRWHARGPCPARPGSCTAWAASRRPTAPGTSPTTPATTRRWSTCAPTRSQASPGTTRPPRSRGTTTPACSSSAGARPGVRSALPSSSSGPTGTSWPAATSPTCSRCRTTSATSSGASSASSCPR